MRSRTLKPDGQGPALARYAKAALPVPAEMAGSGLPVAVLK